MKKTKLETRIFTIHDNVNPKITIDGHIETPDMIRIDGVNWSEAEVLIYTSNNILRKNITYKKGYPA